MESRLIRLFHETIRRFETPFYPSMQAYNPNQLSKLFWDINGTEISINAISKYIACYPDEAVKSIAIWEDQLNNCTEDKKLLYLYVMDNLLQTRRNSTFSVLLESRMSDVFYGVLRDQPSLLPKVQRLVDVWNERSVVTPDKAEEVSRTIRRAIDDYHHNIDRREKKEIREEVTPNHMGSEEDSSFENEDMQSIGSAKPSSSEEDEIELEDDFEEMDEKGEKEYTILLKRLVGQGWHCSKDEEYVDDAQRTINDFPEWTSSVDAFQMNKDALLEDILTTGEVLNRAIEKGTIFKNEAKGILDHRKRLIHCIECIQDSCKRRKIDMEKYRKECEELLDAVNTLEGEDGDIIKRIVYRPCMKSHATIDVSKQALESISKSLQEVEEEKEKERKLREDQLKKEQEMRNLVTDSIIKHSVEDLKGKVWNTKGLIDRILYHCLLNVT